MKNIYAYKIELTKEGFIISCEEGNPELKEVYGSENLKTKLTLPKETIKALKLLLYVHKGVSDMFWLDRTIRKENGLRSIMYLMRHHKLQYEISAYTLCSARL